MRNLNRLSLLIVFLVIITGCSKTPREQLDLYYREFEQRREKAETAIPGLIMQVTADHSFPSAGTLTTRHSLLVEKEGKMIPQYPSGPALSVSPDTVTDTVVQQSFTATLEKGKLTIYRVETDTITPVAFEDPILGITSDPSYVYFYAERQVYRIAPGQEEPELLLEKKFIPPYKKYYHVDMEVGGSNLALSLGIAGTYHIHIIDTSARTVLIESIASASSRFDLENNTLYYIHGTSGKWTLGTYAIDTKEKKAIRNYSKLQDIFIFSDYAIVRKEEGIEITDHTSDTPIHIPFYYRIKGKLMQYALLEYGNSLFLVTPNRLAAELATFYSFIPKEKLSIPESAVDEPDTE